MKFRLKAASGPLTGQTFDLQVETTRIGADAGMDIVLAGLQDTHATIHAKEGGLTIERSSAGEIHVNGEAVKHAQALNSGDEIRLGELRFVLQAPGLRPQRVLDQATPTRRPRWGWLVAGVLLGAAVALAYLYLERPEVLDRALESLSGGEPTREAPATESAADSATDATPNPAPTEEPSP